MTDFPENENLTSQNENEASLQEQNDEFSIFANPVEHKKKATAKKRKRLPIVLASVLAVAVLVGGTVAVVKLIPEMVKDTSSAPTLENIEVLTLSEDDVKAFSVQNSSGRYQLYSEKEKSGETEITNWYIKEYDKEVLSTSAVSGIVDAACAIVASREVTERTAADCGLENPAVKAIVTTEKNGKLEILLGELSPDKSGYYLKLSNSEKIYVVDVSVKESLDFNPLTLADNSAFPAFETSEDMSGYLGDDGLLISFDEMNISGRNLEKAVSIKPNNDNKISTFAQYIVASPEERIAENVDSVLEVFKSGLSVAGAYSFDTSAKSISATGLNSPDMTVSLKIKNKTLTYKFKLQQDGNYAVICDNAKLIKKVDPSNLPFIEYSTTDFYSSWVCLNSIEDLKSFTFKVGDTTHAFGITANSDEESDEKYLIDYNGKSIKSSVFQNFYQKCISLSCNDYTVDDISAKPDYSIIFTFKDEIGGQQVVDFVKSSQTRYQYSLNGVKLGKLTSASLNELVKSLEEMCATAK